VRHGKRGYAGRTVVGCVLLVALQGCCGVCRHCGHQGATGLAQPAIAATSRDHPRFHPVPTHPVFLPRPERSSAIEDNEESEKNAGWHDTEPIDTSSQRGEPAPLPSGPEVIPAPAPDSAEGWEAEESDGDEFRSTGASRISFPSQELEVGKILRSQPDATSDDNETTQ